MKTTLGLVALLALAASPAWAAVEPLSLQPDYVLPQVPASLQMEAFAHGRVVLAIDVSAEGRPTDWLVLGYSHQPLVQPCLEALQKWRFTPARVDGVAVPAQVELTINFRADGIVVSSNMIDEMFVRSIRGDEARLVYRPRVAGELDRVPARVNGAAPKYAAEALRQGVRGKVDVRFYIDETGAVRLPAIDGSAQPYLAAEALEAVRNWKFEPPLSKGRPVLIAASEEFDFGKAD